jgi:hypothetical protein
MNGMSTERTKTTLDKKSIAAIAAQVQTGLRQGGSASSATEENRDDASGRDAKRGHSSKGVFFWGAASGLALAVAAPLLGKQARPAVRGAIKGGILAGRYVQKVASSVKEDVQDLSAEAAADLDAEQHRPEQDGGPKRKAK